MCLVGRYRQPLAGCTITPATSSCPSGGLGPAPPTYSAEQTGFKPSRFCRLGPGSEQLTSAHLKVCLGCTGVGSPHAQGSGFRVLCASPFGAQCQK